ncbi:MAG: alpha/beta fold hydrolase [Candidatus Lokiarchaeota archaeon]|nr:alpha/beta fold hydrolase [Candidatus Lokiarchaeota archaeon]
MQNSTFSFEDNDGFNIFVNKWAPDSGVIKGIIQLAHGMAGRSERWIHVAEALTSAGYIVYANDHRGHGLTAKEEKNLGIIEPGGWAGCVGDLKQLLDIIKKENKDKPIFYIGFSWGSYMGQDLIQEYGEEYKGSIFLGTTGKKEKLFLLKLLLKIIIKKDGSNAKAHKLWDLAIKPFSEPFQPNKTDNDWRTSDLEVLKKFEADPLTGFIETNGFFKGFGDGFSKIWNKKNEQKIPKNLPIYCLSGANDVTNHYTEDMLVLINRYKGYGIADLSYKIYDGDVRHEIHNEKVKEEVFADIISWLDSHL